MAAPTAAAAATAASASAAAARVSTSIGRASRGPRLSSQAVCERPLYITILLTPDPPRSGCMLVVVVVVVVVIVVVAGLELRGSLIGPDDDESNYRR